MTDRDGDTTGREPGDGAFMGAALVLARRGLGAVWPNPAVGCVLVRDCCVVGRGWTQPGGRPHAETEALRRAGEAARGATAYVSLEPCNHHGETPPCTEALIAAGVARCVVAMEDPDPRTAGAGLARLRAAGLAVSEGVLAEDAAEVNLGFWLRTVEGRPTVTLKTATSLDGRIASRTGASKWITGEAARAPAHRLRASHDAVLIGSGTALADDPELTCRLPGLEGRGPVRIVADGRLRLRVRSKLVETARHVPTWVLTREDADPERVSGLTARGVEVMEVDAGTDGHPDPRSVAERLGRRGLTRVLLEGGASLAAAWLRAGLVDRIAWFRAPTVMGGDGVPAVDAIGVETPAMAPAFVRTGLGAIGADAFETFRRGP